MKKYFTDTLDQLQVDFLPSHIHIAFMEYLFSTLGIFFGIIALTLSFNYGRLLQTIKILRPFGELNEEKI